MTATRLSAVLPHPQNPPPLGPFLATPLTQGCTELLRVVRSASVKNIDLQYQEQGNHSKMVNQIQWLCIAQNQSNEIILKIKMVYVCNVNDNLNCKWLALLQVQVQIFIYCLSICMQSTLLTDAVANTIHFTARFCQSFEFSKLFSVCTVWWLHTFKEFESEAWHHHRMPTSWNVF